MSSLSLKNNILISLLFAFFLITSVNVENGMGISAILMLLVSIVGLIATRGQDYPPLQAWEKYWFASLFFFVGLVYVDILRGFGDISDIDAQSRLLLAIPVYLYVRRIGVNLNIVLIGVAIGVIMTGVYAWYQYVELGVERVYGITNPIYYGNIVILLLFLSVIGLISVKNMWFKFLLIVAIFFGMYAALNSGTRGGWITLPILIILFMTYNVWNIALWKRLLSAIMMMIILVGTYYSPDFSVKQRVDNAIESVSAYYIDNRMNAVGYRFEMWKASYLSAKDHNFLGAGENSFKPEMKRLSEEGRVYKGLQYFTDPHSQYFNALLDQGLVGLVSLLFIFLIPLKALLNNLKDQSQSHASAMFSSIILLSFMGFMLTISALEIQIMTIFFAFSISIFLGLFTHNQHHS